MDVIYHTINYTVEELKQIHKTGEVYRKYPRNQKFALDEIQESLKNIVNDIEVSNLGNVKINGDIQPSFKDSKENNRVVLQDKIDYIVYRLVAETWCYVPLESTSGWQVHHIHDDTEDHADNLVWCHSSVHPQPIH